VEGIPPSDQVLFVPGAVTATTGPLIAELGARGELGDRREASVEVEQLGDVFGEPGVGGGTGDVA
jgi:hypothetical protein